MRHFRDYHPLTLTIFYFVIIILVMFYMNIWVALTAAIMGFMWLSIIKHRFQTGYLASAILIIAVITIINSLINHDGETQLFFINNRAVTLEGILYGLNTGIMLVAGILWFAAFSIQVDSEKIMSLFPHMPKTGLLVTLILRLIPDYVNRYRLVTNQEKINNPSENGIKTALKTFSAVFTYALENSMLRAQVMYDRGIDGKKKMYNPYRIRCRDLVLGVFIIACVAGEIILDNIYFKIGIMFILTAMPMILEGGEKIRWNCYSLKMKNFPMAPK